MASHRKELKLNAVQRELVNISVKAQDMLFKHGIGNAFGIPGDFRTTDDLIFKGGHNVSHGLGNVTTNISQEEQSKLINLLNKSQIQEGTDQLLLPSIRTGRKNQQSPFKGNSFFENTTISQKMRKTVISQDQQQQRSSTNRVPAGDEGIGALLKESAHRNSSSSVDKRTQVKMNPKVLETWINETLQDAEHLDIPGVILKPEHKNPLSRYGIDRLALTNAGIPNDMVDRIFRALFVYSVGFYELVKKCLQHTEKKYSIITAIWKVFSILLEYCCKTDYRMLISEISKEHKDELDKLEKEFQQKFQEQAHNERILKQNMEILQKYNEELEKERTNERQMRLKLEEEYMQNTKNHEEEVQLRLKFESKLNNMHSVHRDLETKYKRALNELASLQNTNEQLVNKNNNQLEEITILKTIRAENESKIAYNDEKLSALQREINIKCKQVEDYEDRYTKTQDELDLTKYKLQEASKDITELKLKIDVFESSVSGLKNEKQHLQLELKETKELQKVYEKKCGELMGEMNKINVEFQESKREIIGFGEIQKERDERIDKLKKELRQLKTYHDELDLKHGTLTIHHDKVKEQYDSSKRDLDDAIEKLHVTNKVRHETEVKLNEEIDKTRHFQDVIKDKDEILQKRAQEIEELDKKTIELDRACEALEIKKAGIERQYELTKKQLNEKVQNLNDVLASEKETREMWIERYEKEQRDHTSTNAQLLASKSQLKDQILSAKNAEIKLQTQIKANEVLSESNIRLQDSLNECLAKCENIERELNTQKEITKQMDQSKREYIQKLKRELETVESRFYQRIEQQQMISEDLQSRAAKNWLELTVVKINYYEQEQELKLAKEKIEETLKRIEQLELETRQLEMSVEDVTSQHVWLGQAKIIVDDLHTQFKQKSETLDSQNKLLKLDADQKLKYQNEYNEILKQHGGLKKQHNKLIQELQVLQANQQVSGKLPQPKQTPGANNDAQVQTSISGSQIDHALQGVSLQTNDSQQQRNDAAGKAQGIRVGGGGEIKKPARPQNPNSKQQQPPPNLALNGSIHPAAQPSLPSTQPNQGQNSNKSIIGQSRKSGKDISGQGNQQQQQRVSNLEIQPQQNNNNQIQMIQQIHPQTSTNQQNKVPQLQFQNIQSTQKGNEAKMTSPRASAQNEYLQANSNFNDNDQETMASKVSPGVVRNQKASNQDYTEGNSMQSSFIQSPMATTTIQNNINTTRDLHQNNPQQQRLQQTLVDGSQANLPGSEYQTIQSTQHLGNPLQQQDPEQMYQYSQNYQQDGQDIIFEQQYEDDEERKTQNDLHSYQSNAQLSNNFGGKSSQTSQGGIRAAASRKSNRVVVDYKGMSTVLQQSQMNLGDGSGTNQSRMSNPASLGFQNQRFNKQTSQFEITGEQQLTGFNNAEGEEGDPQFVYDEEKEIDKQNEESFAQEESLMNQSVYNNLAPQPMSNQYSHEQSAAQSRMKVDVNAQERKSNQRLTEQQQKVQNDYLQSPISHLSNQSNLQQPKFGLQPISQVNVNNSSQQQQDPNRKVKGKTSIRSLIKAAATRENH